MDKKKIDTIKIRKDITLKEAMRIIDTGGIHTALIVDEAEKLLGILTDGDIKRAILRGLDSEDIVQTIMNTNYKYVVLKTSEADIKKIIIDNLITGVPLIDDNNNVLDFIFLSIDNQIKSYNKQDSLNNQLKQVAILGGGGYIGSVLARKLLRKGYSVVILDKFIYGKESVVDLRSNSHVKIIEGDTRHVEDISLAVASSDAVVHLAELVGDPAAALNPRVTQQINYLATKIIAEVCKYYQINRMIYASSCSVYGASSNGSLLNEDSPLNPVSLYAKMKITSENTLREMQDKNFRPTILRFATVFGQSYRPRFDLVVNTLTAKAVQEGKISIFGGNQWRPNVHVEDIAETIIAVLEAPISVVGGEVFNVGSEENNYTINDLGKKVKEVIPSADLVIEERNVDLRDYKVDFSKLRNAIGKNDWKSITYGVAEIKKFLEENPEINYTNKVYSNIKFLGDEYVL